MHGQKIGGLVKEVSPSAPEVVAYISTGDEDRTGEVLEPGGWDLAAFKSTGVVSFSHGGWGTPVAGLPIGKALDIWADEKGLLAHTRFAVDQPDPVGSWATLLYGLLKDGYIKGWSVWFDPLQWVEPDGTEVTRKRGAGWYGPNPGRRYKRQELLEYGPVFIPANPEAATVVAKSLEGLQEKGIWLPPSFVQEPGFAVLHRALRHEGKPEAEPQPGLDELERQEKDYEIASVDGAALAHGLTGALSEIRRATARMRNPLRRRVF